MKITMNIDCTPEEARRFLGLPDVAPMQEELMKEFQDRMMESLNAMDPESVMKTWFPAAGTGWENIQKAFWSQFAGGGAKSKD